MYKRQELYDEIVKGYENGTREIYVADENGPRKLTKDEDDMAKSTKTLYLYFLPFFHIAPRCV